MNPQTSIIIPVRDGARFIVEAIASVLAQAHETDEVIVVDDHSRDATRGLVEALADPRLSILSAAREGVSAARNLGLERARGTYVAFLDHDDLWPNGRHMRLAVALDGAPGQAAAFGRVRLRFEPDAVRTPGDADLDGKHICELVGSGLYRRAAVLAISGFDETMRLREDADFHLRLLENGLSPLLIDADALIYRRHGGNVTRDQAALNAALLEVARRKLTRQRGKRS